MSNFQKPGQGPDDLLTPSLGRDQQPVKQNNKPWLPQSMMYVAFFGGALAYTVIAIINGRRIGLSKDKINLIALLCFVGLAVSFSIHSIYPVIDSNFILHKENKLAIRLGDRVIGVVLYLICAPFINNANRVYQYRYQTGYASLLGPGIAACIVCGTIQMLLIYAVMFALGIN